MQDRLLTPAEIADKLQVHERTVHRWIKDGKLQAIRIERFWRIEQKDFQTFLNEHRVRVQ